MLRERMSPTMAGRLLSYPLAKVAYLLESPFEATPAMMRGNRWEHLLHDPNARRECFKGTATRGAKFKVWADEFRQEVSDYMLETEAERVETDAFLESVPEEVRTICQNSEYQSYLESMLEHCYCDFMHDRTRTIYEMKVVSDSSSFVNDCFRRHYDHQAYVQRKLAGPEWSFKWLVFEASAPYHLTIWEATPEVFESGRQKNVAALHLFERLNAGDWGTYDERKLEVPKWRLNECLQ